MKYKKLREILVGCIFAFAFPMIANAGVLLGDVNLDGTVNLLDVAPFVGVISNRDFQPEADINQDGAVNLLDVEPFIVILSGGPATEIVVLRDTIGLDSSETDGLPSGFANTNSGSLWSSPGLVLTNSTNEVVTLHELRLVISASDGENPLNDIHTIQSLPVNFHLWIDGIEGAGDTYANNPMGAETNGHVVIPLDYEANASMVEFGFSDSFVNYILSVDIAPANIKLQPRQQVVLSTLQQLTTQETKFIGVRFSRIFPGQQDLFQTEDTPANELPGYLMDGLGLPVEAFAGIVSVEIPIK